MTSAAQTVSVANALGVPGYPIGYSIPFFFLFFRKDFFFFFLQGTVGTVLFVTTPTFDSHWGIFQKLGAGRKEKKSLRINTGRFGLHRHQFVLLCKPHSYQAIMKVIERGNPLRREDEFFFFFSSLISFSFIWLSFDSYTVSTIDSSSSFWPL